jgi:hypothetical protein
MVKCCTELVSANVGCALVHNDGQGSYVQIALERAIAIKAPKYLFYRVDRRFLTSFFVSSFGQHFFEVAGIMQVGCPRKFSNVFLILWNASGWFSTGKP